MLVCAVAPVSGSCFSSAVALGGVWCFHRVISGCLQLQAHRKKTKIKLCARVCVCARSPPARGTPARGTVKCAGVNKQGLAVASAVLARTRLPDPRARLPVELSSRDGPWLASHIQKTLSPPWAAGPTGAVAGGFSACFFEPFLCRACRLATLCLARVVVTGLFTVPPWAVGQRALEGSCGAVALAAHDTQGTLGVVTTRH